MRRLTVISLAFLLAAASVASAQFIGPSVTEKVSSVQEVRQVRLGSYVTVMGHIVAHQREDYFTFRDETGEIRVEIEKSVWQGRKITPQTKVKLFGEVDPGLGGRYIWIESLQVVD